MGPTPCTHTHASPFPPPLHACCMLPHASHAMPRPSQGCGAMCHSLLGPPGGLTGPPKPQKPPRSKNNEITLRGETHLNNIRKIWVTGDGGPCPGKSSNGTLGVLAVLRAQAPWMGRPRAEYAWQGPMMHGECVAMRGAWFRGVWLRAGRVG